jgi:hypothetical protein
MDFNNTKDFKKRSLEYSESLVAPKYLKVTPASGDGVGIPATQKSKNKFSEPIINASARAHFVTKPYKSGWHKNFKFGTLLFAFQNDKITRDSVLASLQVVNNHLLLCTSTHMREMKDKTFFDAHVDTPQQAALQWPFLGVVYDDQNDMKQQRYDSLYSVVVQKVAHVNNIWGDVHPGDELYLVFKWVTVKYNPICGPDGSGLSLNKTSAEHKAIQLVPMVNITRLDVDSENDVGVHTFGAKVHVGVVHTNNRTDINAKSPNTDTEHTVSSSSLIRQSVANKQPLISVFLRI